MTDDNHAKLQSIVTCGYCGRPLGDEKQLEEADFENTQPGLCFSDVLVGVDEDPYCYKVFLQEAGLTEKETEGPTGGGGVDHAHTIRLLGKKAKQVKECSGCADCLCFHCADVRQHERAKIARVLRLYANEFMPTKTNNAKMRMACAANLADAIERHLLDES